jgi:type VI secretion system secreted protein VgrG
LVLASGHWLQQRRDTRIFQDQSAQDIVSAVFQAYPQAHFKFDVAKPGPLRAITTQYRVRPEQLPQATASAT